VGILVHKNIHGGNFKILGREVDEEGNFLLLNTETNSVKYKIGSVCGPNHDDLLSTYVKLKRGRLRIKNENVIIGRDFNATWDNSRVNSNMADIPSKMRTMKIKEIAEEIGLTDPYRILNPI
jgi:hypothetical protein